MLTKADEILLGRIREMWTKGQAALKKEKAYADMASVIGYVEGRDQVPERSKSISQTYDNRVRKIMTDMVSAFTEVRPIWNFQTRNPRYASQADILSKLARSWWKNSHAEKRLQSVITYAFAGGSGYCAVRWNPHLPGGGDIELKPVDPRDVVPITPQHVDSVQEWEGLIVRERVPIEVLKQRYPNKAHLIGQTKSRWGGETGGVTGRAREMFTPAWRMLFREASPTSSLGTDDGCTDLYRVYMRDYSENTGASPVMMGTPPYEYEVYPVGSTFPPGHRRAGQKVSSEFSRLYPRGRVLLCTPDTMLDDLPNPYWHGLYPIVRFTLVPLPWSHLGASVGADLLPLQNALNEGLRGLEDGIAQWIRRPIIADKNAVPRAELDALDPRRSGLKLRVNATMGEGVKFLDGPQFPEWYMETLEYFKNEMDDLSGVRGLQQLAALKQMPAADTLEKYMDAMSPSLKVMAHSIEISLAEVAYQFMVNVFQYYDAPRRMQMLGPDGVSLEDFDYDPNELTPSMMPADEGYIEDYDATQTTRQERAQTHYQNFTFEVAPGSLLNVSHTGHKMMILQATRMNLCDPWTFWKSLDIAGAGEPPAETIPERMIAARKLGLQPGPLPEQIQMQLMAQMLQFQMMQAQATGGAPPGGGGAAPPVPEAPPTTGTGAQGGRPPSGNQPPTMTMRDGGTRPVISESGR